MVKNREGMSRAELKKKLVLSCEENRILKDQLSVILADQCDRSAAEILREAAFQQAILIAELREKEEVLSKLVITDGLTGLYNHRHFQQRLREEFERIKRYSGELSLIMIDIDNFKNYNDTHGHPAGDKVLLTVANLLLDNARHSDIVARYGGEEFVILCHSGIKDTIGVAERFRREIEKAEIPGQEQQPLLAGQTEGNLTICLGVAAYDASMSDAGTLVERADKKLYQAKDEGRNRVAY
ncbi:MAG: GGDEF domain-containing protein [Deltaproteobacteria bacterium]|nr:GGDEF domain-containing protein [Candidatus Tharpella aukensis]